MREASPVVISRAATIGRALEVMNRSGYRILLVVDEQGRLVQTVSDGDVRRLILRGGSVESAVTDLAATPPICADEGISAYDALSLMNRHEIDHVPVVDSERRPLGVHLRVDIDCRIFLSAPHMSGEERAFVDEAFETNWIAPLGPNVDAFESEFATTVGVRAAAAVASGTAALHLALRLVGVRRGDVVLCSSFTFVATANPILYEGAVPAFIDSEEESWNMSPAALRAALEYFDAQGVKPAAVVVANIYGQSARYDQLLPLCRDRGIPVIEDAAESLGATYGGRASGTFGTVGVYSFNGNKIITTSGGGMLVSDDEALVERARFLSTQARDVAPHYEHSEVGFNYRMSNVLAGIGRGQLKVLSQRVEARRRLFERYRDRLADLEAIRWMPEVPTGRSTRWLSVALVAQNGEAVRVDRLAERLGREGIEARRVWKPLHLQPLYARSIHFSHGRGVSEALFSEGLCLPSASSLEDTDQDRIIATLRRILTEAG